MPSSVLPEALTAQILQHVPQQQRLKQCALVCKAWAAAATEVTVHVEGSLDNMPPGALAALESWLVKHGGQLESLKLCGGTNLLQLPLDKLGKLQRLQLERLSVRLPGDSDSSWDRSCLESGSDTDESAGTSSSEEGDGWGWVDDLGCGEEEEHEEQEEQEDEDEEQGDEEEGEEGEGEEEEEEEEEGDTQTAARTLLPCLQHLQLSVVQFASPSSLLQLAAPALISLKAHRVGYVQYDSHSGAQQVAGAVAGLLQQLPRLVILELPEMCISDTAMQHIGAMQGLQHVSLKHSLLIAPCDLQPLPSSITQLCFRGNPYGHVYYGAGRGLPARLQQLSGLLRLQLVDCRATAAVPPTLLGSFASMQMLQLEKCSLLPNGSNDQSKGTAALLDALAGMTCLQDLQLLDMQLNSTGTAPQDFAAMTASTQLTRLVLRSGGGTVLPPGAAQYMFSAGRPLPLLQQLVITPVVDSDTPRYSNDACIDGADIGCIASCCTGLRWLDLALSVRPLSDMATLLQLPRTCRTLVLGGGAVTQAAAAVLGQLSQLTHLSLCNTASFTDAGLEQLAGLKLKRLDVCDAALSSAVSRGGKLELASTSHKVRPRLTTGRPNLFFCAGTAAVGC
jgi:hypothetical protein